MALHRLIDNVSTNTTSSTLVGRGGKGVIYYFGDFIGATATIQVKHSLAPASAWSPLQYQGSDATFTGHVNLQLDHFAQGMALRIVVAGVTNPSTDISIWLTT